MSFAKAADGVGAAARMERNQNVAIGPVVALRQAHLVAELFKNPDPTKRGDLVAVVELQRRRRDELYIHAADYFAQVRKPAQTSRRSGV